MEQDFSELTNKYAFDDFYLYTFRRDVKTAVEILDAYAGVGLTADQIKEKHGFYRRFRNGEDIAFTDENQLINDLLTMFRTYWDNVFMLLPITV